MCGIIGSVSGRSLLNKSIVDTLFHRGPDSGNLWQDSKGKTVFGHRRLSIIDLAEAANQPFFSISGRYVMVYNGEVYNYRDLVSKNSLRLKTQSDTEALLEFLVQEGFDQITQLNGMFALAIYDKETDEIHLFRDRLGIKPLYYYHDGNRFAFASELPALKELIGDVEINQDVIPLFLHRGYIPEPYTFYKNIYKFPAGAYGLYKNGKLTIKKYWRPEDHITETVLHSEAQVLQKVEELLRDSVQMRLMSDVPFGTFLSGGADSGLITAMAADQLKEPILTFNVSFEDAAFDESPFAKAMADHLGAKYHHIHVTRKEVMDNLEQGIDLLGEPFIDSSVFPTMAVSKFAAQHVKMVLSGDGGDELFMGYGAYTWADRMTKYWPYRKVLTMALRASGKTRNKRAANVFDAPSKAELFAHIFSQEQNLFSRKEIERISNKEFIDPYSPSKKARDFSPAEEQAFFDLTNYLKDDLLVKVDRASMRYSLEARVPFLDHRLVELSLNIDPKLKRKNRESKYLIKKIMERYYPNELIYRQKWGFSIPLEKWMKEYHPYRVSAVYEKPYNEINRNYQSGDDYLYNRLYALKVLSRYI
ncbi:asparagine synthase (glutamine-hydrolyzing) [Cryomorphaceae bacterium 1068]|nr:asparagine synthase (glutamine-hydrolyzing) [Cryomorphaceae bacterium 1068]